MRQFHGMPRSASAIGRDASAVVQHHDPRARGCRVAHGALGAALAAQEPGQAIPAGRQQFGRARLHDLPDARRALDGQRVGAAEQRQVGDAFQRAGQQIDHQRIAEIEARGRARVEVRDQHPDPGAACRTWSATRSHRSRGCGTPPSRRAREPHAPRPSADARAGPRSAAAGPSAPHPARRTRRRASATPRGDRRAAGRRSPGPGGPPRCRAPRRRRWRRAADRPAARHAPAGSRRPDRARGARAADGTPPSRAPPTPPSARGGSGARPPRAAPPSGSSRRRSASCPR